MGELTNVDEEIKTTSDSNFIAFLDEVKSDYQTCFKSGTYICVQVESIKQRKVKGGTKNKENAMLDSQAIPARKKKKTGKKVHNLGKNISKNQPN
ncbi:hypothetical protein C2G38_2236966 [Gigaspora rosea]|uniref:Uncharacterized protein n=1 Tax=Gigaspora rosea TaxID=44941 RepID=A0A397TNV0_9GLOM|nr:hypothetical protein C2G38_2236966 [Gigaspora rosea]